MIGEFPKLLRIHQWHKNGFVLLGFFLLGEYQNYGLLIKAVLMTLAFCLASSAVYIFNDFCDIESDRKHPIKKNRPLAAGTIRVEAALPLAVLLLISSLAISYFNGSTSLLVISAYLVNNLLYSVFLKSYPIIDTFQIALGFMLRIFAGTEGIGIVISEWMVITGFMLSLLIGFSKRYAELSNYSDPRNHRKVLQSYSIETLRSFVLVMASSTIVTYALYTVSATSIEQHGTTHLIYTTPIVIFGIFRFLYLVIFNRRGEDPADQVLKDKQLAITCIFWAITYGLIIS